MKLAMFSAIFTVLCICAANAETLVAARTIRSHAIIGPGDFVILDTDTIGAFENPEDIVGLEARVVLYQGRPIKKSDVGAAAIIERNQIIVLIFERNGLSIATEARSLGRAGVGDRLRVMNLASRSTVTGLVQNDGSVMVANVPTLSK